MSVKSAPYYWLECDSCGEKSTEGTDYSAWSDEGDAYDQAYNHDWVRIPAGDYCPDCSPVICEQCDEKPATTEHDDTEWCDDCLHHELTKGPS